MRSERTRQGISLADVSSRTRIPEKLLEEIEADHFNRLPGTIFARNFVRQYAAVVGVDPEPLLAEMPRYDIESAPMPAPQARVDRKHRNRRPGSVVSNAGWLLLATATAVFAYFHFNSPPPELSADVPVTSPAVPARQEPRPAALESTFAPPSAPEAKPVQVLLTAMEPAWVKIDKDGKSEFTGLMQTNERREISADQFVGVFTGNAGGVSVTLNGKVLEPLGPAGQVRNVRLTAEGLRPVLKSQSEVPASDRL